MIKTNSKRINYLLLIIACTFVIVVWAHVLYVRYATDVVIQKKVAFSVAKWQLFWLAHTNVAIELNPETLGKNTYVEFQTSGCDGECPEYKITFFGDGQVRFEGHKNICADTLVTHIDKKLVYDLVNKLMLFDFFNRPNYKSSMVFDSPLIYMGLNVNNKKHVVEYYEGSISTPFILKLVEHDILQIVESLDVYIHYTPDRQAGFCKSF